MNCLKVFSLGQKRSTQRKKVQLKKKVRKHWITIINICLKETILVLIETFVIILNLKFTPVDIFNNQFYKM